MTGREMLFAAWGITPDQLTDDQICGAIDVGLALYACISTGMLFMMSRSDIPVQIARSFMIEIEPIIAISDKVKADRMADDAVSEAERIFEDLRNDGSA